MKLTIKPLKIPFTVGATVWVNQADEHTRQYAYFQATIIQVILNGSVANGMVICRSGDSHELAIIDGIYDLKPVGAYGNWADKRQRSTS